MRLLRMFTWLCIVGCVVGCVVGIGSLLPAVAQASPAAAAGWGLPQLMRSLAGVKSANASFTERKTIAILDAPLVAEGTLSYRAPDWMEKVTASPVPERFVLDGHQVTITGADHQAHVFSTNDDPLIGGLTEGIIGTLAGDLPALQHVYAVRLSGGAAGWQLVLTPRDAALARMISWICIRGHGNRIGTIETESGNGDHSDMSVDEDVTDAG